MKKNNLADGQLKEVKTAGYKFSRREKNVNKKAGLHDKKENLAEGETRVKRRKPLALKHVRRMRKAAVALSCVFVVAAGAVGAGAFLGEEGTSYTGYKTVCYEVPKPALNPTEYTLVENVGFMNYVLQNQPFWSSEMFSDVNAMGFQQHVETYKQYYDGILISCDIADGFSHKATQYCVNTDKEVIMWRPAVGKFDGMNSEWSKDKASKTDFEKFIEWRGFPPSEFSVYVLNEKTIKNAEEYSVVQNADGNFEMTLELNVGLSTDEAEFAADCYYVKQMKATGDLPSLPTIKKTDITYVFDENWRVLSFVIRDEYTAMGFPCSSEVVVTFDYAEESAKNSFYEDYFKNYEDSVSSDITDDSPSASTYLGSAFGSVLTDGGIFKLDLKVDNLDLNGVAYVGMKDKKLTDLRVKIGDISVFGGSDGEFYVSDGIAKYKLNLGGLFASEEPSAESRGAGLDTDALMQQLMNGKLTVGKNSAQLESVLELFGLKVGLTFDFVHGGAGISLGCVEAKIPLGDKLIKANLKFGTESDIPAKPADTSDYTDILNEGLTVDLAVKTGELALNGFAHVSMNSGEFRGVYAKLGDLSVYYDYPADMLGFSDGNAKYKLGLAGLSNGSQLDFNSLLSGADVSSLLSQILNGFSAGDGKISSSATLELLGQTVTAALGVKLTGGIKIDANVNALGQEISLSLGLINKTVELPDLGEYTDILNDGITLDAKLALDGAELDGKITVNLSQGKLTALTAEFGDIRVDYENSSKILYIAIGTTKAFVNLGQISYGTADMSGLFGGEASKLICELLSNLSAGLREISTNVDVNVFDCIIPVNASIVLPADGGGLKVKADVMLFGISANVTAGLDTAKVPALSEGEKEAYIDALKKPFEVVNQAIGGRITASVSGTLYDGGSKYDLSNGKKYTFGATLEYDSGKDYLSESAREACNPLFLHVNIGLTALTANDDSLYLDLLVTDANPTSTDDNGRTLGGYFTDGVLDVYLSVSNGRGNKTPLKIYADIDEILTLVSMVGSAANLGDVYFEDSAVLNEAVAKISELIDGKLIEKYLPYTKDQFSSLGASLIPQILGKPLGEFLNDIVSKLGKDAGASGGENGKINLTAPYIESLTYGDNDLKIELNSSAVYGANIAKENNLTVVISKDVLEDGASRLSGMDFKNIYFGESNVNKIDLKLELGYGEIVRPDAAAWLSGYLNTQGIDTLLKALVNSATHETGASYDGKKAYELNDTYLLSGTVTADMLSVVKVDLNVKTLKIVIKEDNTVYADAHIYYYYELTKLSKTSGDLYMSVMNDMAVIKRVRKGAEETRIMPADVFTDDIINQIGWMFDFPDWIMNIIKGQVDKGNGGSGVKLDNKDFGEILDYVIPQYKYGFSESDNTAIWDVKIGGGLLKDLAGITFNDIPVRFKAVKDASGMYTVTDLSILPTSINFGVSLNLSADFRYNNPHEEITDGYSDSSRDLINGELAEINGNSWHKVLGGESFADIYAATDWELLKKETGLNYLDFKNGSPLAVATLGFEYAEDNTNTKFTQFGEKQLVLYNKNTNSVYTRVSVPELPADKNVSGSKLDWNEELIKDGDFITCRAEFKNTYKVTVESAFDIGENYIFDEALNVYRRTEEEAYKQILLKKDIVYRTDNATYSLLGYTYKGSDGLISFADTAFDGDGDECFVAEVNAHADYVAVWRFSYEITFTVIGENGEEESVSVHYYAGEKLSSRLPAIPERKGHAGVWDYAEDVTISPDMPDELSTVYAVYTPNTYTVTIVSELEAEGFEADGNGKYVKTYSLIYNSELTLGAAASTHNGYKFSGYRDGDKNPVNAVVVQEDITYYAEWSGKTVSVAYRSDVGFAGANFADGLYAVSGKTLKYGVEGETLWGVGDSENLFLGWFLETVAEDGSKSYSYVKDADAVKAAVEPMLADKDGITVELYATWAVDEINVNLDKVSGTYWSFEGDYSLVFAEGISANIASSAGVSAKVSVIYYAHGKAGLFGGYKEFTYDEIGNTGSTPLTGLSGSLDKSGMQCGKGTAGAKNLKGSVTVSAVFVCDGFELAQTGKFEQFCNHG